MKTVEKFIQQQEYSFRKSTNGSRISNAKGYNEGQKAGQDINVNPQKKNSNSSTKLLK